MEGFNGVRVIEEFEAMTEDAERFQRETLKKILTENGCAEYLQGLGLNGRTDPESYKACVPLVTHKDLEPYIQRIADGDSSPILTVKPITTISLRYVFVNFITCMLPQLCCFIKHLQSFLCYLQFWYHSGKAQVCTIQQRIDGNYRPNI